MTIETNWRDGSWRIIDEDGDEFISADTIAMVAKDDGDKRSPFEEAVATCRDLNDDPEVPGVFSPVFVQPTAEVFALNTADFNEPTSYMPQVLVDGGWNSNALRFRTYQEAEASAQNLHSRWTLTSDYRAVISDDAVTHVWDFDLGGSRALGSSYTHVAPRRVTLD